MTRTIRSAAIVGAGVVGVATAYALARRGVLVTLIDAHGEPAHGASHANGAQLSYFYTDALASHRLIAQLPSLALGRDESFRMRISFDPDFFRWIAAFLRNCTADRFRQNTLTALKLSLESRLQMAALQRKHQLSFGHAVHGKMHLFHTEEAFAVARETMALKAAPYSAQQALSFDEARRIEPALEFAAPRPAGIVYTPSEAVGDSFQFSSQLLALLQSAYGARAYFNSRVERIKTDGSGAILSAGGRDVEADVAVICAGAEAHRLLRPLGVRIPIWPMKGYSFTAPPGGAAPVVSITDTTRRLVVTRLHNAVRVAGLADLGWRSTELDKNRAATLMRMAREAMPEAANYDKVTQFWSGLRPMTPDSLPRIGQAGPALAYNVGHGMLGWTMAMGAAERLAQKIAPGTDISTEENTDSYDTVTAPIERFA